MRCGRAGNHVVRRRVGQAPGRHAVRSRWQPRYDVARGRAPDVMRCGRAGNHVVRRRAGRAPDVMRSGRSAAGSYDVTTEPAANRGPPEGGAGRTYCCWPVRGSMTLPRIWPTRPRRRRRSGPTARGSGPEVEPPPVRASVSPASGSGPGRWSPRAPRTARTRVGDAARARCRRGRRPAGAAYPPSWRCLLGPRAGSTVGLGRPARRWSPRRRRGPADRLDRRTAALGHRCAASASMVCRVRAARISSSRAAGGTSGSSAASWSRLEERSRAARRSRRRCRGGRNRPAAGRRPRSPGR